MPARSVVVPFALALPKESSVARGQHLSKSYQVRGVARLEGDRLTLEWSGSIEITEVSGANVRTLRESVPAQRLVLPTARIASIELRGRWWRPSIELRATGIRPLDLVPSSIAGSVVLRLARRDRQAAAELVSQVQLAMADIALREAESGSQLSRESRADPRA